MANNLGERAAVLVSIATGEVGDTRGKGMGVRHLVPPH